MGSCGGEPPGGDGGTRNGGTGAIFQGTVTGRGALRHLSRAARSRAFLGTNRVCVADRALQGVGLALVRIRKNPSGSETAFIRPFDPATFL